MFGIVSLESHGSLYMSQNGVCHISNEVLSKGFIFETCYVGGCWYMYVSAWVSKIIL